MNLNPEVWSNPTEALHRKIRKFIEQDMEYVDDSIRSRKSRLLECFRALFNYPETITEIKTTYKDVFDLAILASNFYNLSDIEDKEHQWSPLTEKHLVCHVRNKSIQKNLITGRIYYQGARVFLKPSIEFSHWVQYRNIHSHIQIDLPLKPGFKGHYTYLSRALDNDQVENWTRYVLINVREESGFHKELMDHWLESRRAMYVLGLESCGSKLCHRASAYLTKRTAAEIMMQLNLDPEALSELQISFGTVEARSRVIQASQAGSLNPVFVRCKPENVTRDAMLVAQRYMLHCFSLAKPGSILNGVELEPVGDGLTRHGFYFLKPVFLS